jgi:DNA-binding transcriptional LysR family regulator
VVAPGFLPMPITDEITPEQMRGFVQCVIRDTARHMDRPNFYLIEGARNWTVGDQLMKKEIILQGAAWGHMPDFLIEEELRDGRLLSIGGRHLKGGQLGITAARRRDLPHGPIASLLWRHIEAQSKRVSPPAAS